jgi:hypothetical protein
MPTENTAAATDNFTFPTGHPRAVSHRFLSEYLHDPKTSTLPADSAKFEKPDQLALLCAALERADYQKTNTKKVNTALSDLIKKLSGRKLSFTEESLVLAVSHSANILMPEDPNHIQWSQLDAPLPGVTPALLDALEALTKEKPLSKELLESVTRLHTALRPLKFWGGNKKSVDRLEALVEGKPVGLPDDDEAWAAAIRRDIDTMPAAKRKNWLALLENAPKGTTAKPTAKWRKQADELLAAVGPEEFARQIEHWFALVGSKATERIQPRNATLLRSLAWYAGLVTGETVCRALANAVEGGLRKLPRGALYASSISKACIATLEGMSGMEPIAQLSRLKHRIKSPWGLEEVEKAFTNSVQRSGIARAEIEEICVPNFGLDKDGALTQKVGDYTAKLRIAATHDVELTWFDSAGKEFDGKPKFSAAETAEAKSVKQLAGDIEKMLTAQRSRIENFVERDRIWNFDTWQARYLDHPLLSQLTRRLIWQFTQGKQTTTAIWHNDKLTDVHGHALDWLSPKTEVRLWHPLGVEAGQVQSWRRWLFEHEVTQPFKQAHREIYIITDPERTTRTYSNRFAGHILRQHQFKALCDQSGWRFEFLGNWDGGSNGAMKDLPGWDLRAEFWIDGADTEYADSGVALHVATDQVRFSRPDGSAVELAEVPALVFTEIMRDVDLFVSVCTVGNDPNWIDSEARRTEEDYWRKWSFGALNATAATRREILESLVPKLKIAAKCSLDEKFLVVRGSLRTYKIHLGSGNILMEPNDQYLCIVPQRSADRATAMSGIFLPFEGDNLLSVIISKAFLLAEDSKIKDESILRQIKPEK